MYRQKTCSTCSCFTNNTCEYKDADDSARTGKERACFDYDVDYLKVASEAMAQYK